MKLIQGVPLEAYVFLGLVAAALLCLIIFYLYLNKKLCFAECGGFPCIDRIPVKKTPKDRLGTSYNREDEGGSSSDSDDEVLRCYQTVTKSASRNSMRSATSEGAARQQGVYDNSAYLSPDDDLPSGGQSMGASYSDVPQVMSSPAASRSSKEERKATPDRGPSSAASQSSMEHGMLKPGETYQTSRQPSDEHLFDVSDLEGREPVIISKCGNLEVTFTYNKARGQMGVMVHTAKDIPTKERGGSNNNQVRLMLLPNKKQHFKTKIKAGDNPSFEESYGFRVPHDEIDQMGVRFRVYGCERMRKERLVGECIIGFAAINQDVATTHLLTLEPRSNLSHGESAGDLSGSLSRSESGSSTQSMQHGGMPELLIGLSYNGTTGRLSVEVIKGSNFRNMAMNRAPDTYVKLTLMSPGGQEIARSKTSVRRGQPNPLFKETFMFQVALFQLPDVTLMVSVYNKRNMKRKDMIGWFSIGYNNSGDEELAHWTEMRENKGEQVCRWHALLEG